MEIFYLIKVWKFYARKGPNTKRFKVTLSQIRFRKLVYYFVFWYHSLGDISRRGKDIIGYPKQEVFDENFDELSSSLILHPMACSNIDYRLHVSCERIRKCNLSIIWSSFWRNVKAIQICTIWHQRKWSSFKKLITWRSLC